MRHFQTELPLSLYIHLPWCLHKCPYCDFNSHALKPHSELPEQAYIAALIRDVEHSLPLIWGRSIVSIFIGGGTPSLFSAAGIKALLTQLRALLMWRPNIEITLEANPGSRVVPNLAGYLQAGVNRLSIGVQSFQETALTQLGRIHNSEQAKVAITAAMDAGFTRINIDLMHGLPQQTTAQALEDLQQACAFNSTHLSWYQLTLEPNTVFHRYPPTLPNDDQLSEIQHTGYDYLKTQHFKQYEISAFARGDDVCQHNLNYWQFGDYLGIGAGAHSKITDHTTGKVCRIRKVKQPTRYLAARGAAMLAERTEVQDPSLVFECMLNVLRLRQPIPWSLLTTRTGLTRQHFLPGLTQAKARDLIHWDATEIRLTALGQRFTDDVIALFLPH